MQWIQVHQHYWKVNNSGKLKRKINLLAITVIFINDSVSPVSNWTQVPTNASTLTNVKIKSLHAKFMKNASTTSVHTLAFPTAPLEWSLLEGLVEVRNL